MKGKEWQEAMSKRTVQQLTRLNNALVVLSEDPDIKKEFTGMGLFDGFPSLLGIVNETVRSKNKENYNERAQLDKGIRRNEKQFLHDLTGQDEEDYNEQ